MLRPVLVANAASCAVFGFVFIFFGSETSQFVGDPPLLLIQVLGAGLVANAGLLIAAAFQAQPSRGSIMMFVLGDAAWVIATAVLLLLGVWITTTPGVIWSTSIAAFVGMCGLLQWRWAPN